MPKPISAMTPAQIAQELENFEIWRLSPDLARRAAVVKHADRHAALMDARDGARG